MVLAADSPRFPIGGIPGCEGFPGTTPGGSLKHRMRHLLVILKTVALLLLAVALARPQSVSQGQDVHSEGIDIVVALDISASMLAQDFHPDRVGAAKTGRR